MTVLATTDIGTATYTVEWLIRFGALAFVPRGRAPAATSAWLLLIFFLPVPGALLYLAIGRPRFPAWRAERFQKLLPFFDDVAARIDASAPPAPDATRAIATLARNLGRLPAAGGCSVELLDDYDDVISRLVADIDAARRSVRLLVYIFASDTVGQVVIAALRRAVARGVSCQVMLDSVGSKHWGRETMRLLREAGVDARQALPFRLLRARTRRDMRDHRKLFVIDGMIGFAGSQNIVAKDFRPGVVNRELVARVTGPTVAAMEAVIHADWCLETADGPDGALEIPSPTGDACTQLLPSGADYRLEGFETLLVWQIHRARTRVVIVTPYFIPDADVVSAMRTAAARGVEIDLIVSKVMDQPLVNLAQCSYYDDLLASGVRIYLFRTYLLHAKNVSVDGQFAIVGSSNVDLRSFQLNEEASLLLLDTVSAGRVEEIQRGYIQGSDRLRLDGWRERSTLRKGAENIARLISPLL